MTSYLSVDIETTGLPSNPNTRMISIGIVLTDEKENTIQSYYSLVRPDNFQWSETGPVFEAHKITNEMAQTQGKDICDIFNDIRPLLEKATHIVGYNIEQCDSIVLSREFLTYGQQDLWNLFHSKPHICVMKMFRFSNRKTTKKYKLDICFESCLNIPRAEERKHNALCDAEDTIKCFFIMKNDQVSVNTEPAFITMTV